MNTGNQNRGGYGGRGGPGGGRGGPGGGHGGPRRGPGGNRPYEKKDDFNEKVLDLRRVTRVMAGGKRFRFRATVIVGDGKGHVGVGVAKGLDVQSSVGKAKLEAKKALLTIDLKDGRTIHHAVEAKYSAAKVLIKPATEGHGLKAGGAVRSVLALAGIKDATAKILGRTPNKLTNALAAIEALRMVQLHRNAK